MGTKKVGRAKNTRAGATSNAASAPETDKARKAATTELQQRPEGKPIVASNANKKVGNVPKVTTIAKPKRISALYAAAQLIAGTSKPMRAKDLIEQMEAKGLWKSPGGKTPEATLYAAIIREIAAKGVDARFEKHDKGLFVAGKRR